jgi:hypothetical protein
VWRFAQVVVRVRPAVSLPVDGKDLFFVRKTSPTSVAVGDRAFGVDGFLDDRASQVNSCFRCSAVTSSTAASSLELATVVSFLEPTNSW